MSKSVEVVADLSSIQNMVVVGDEMNGDEDDKRILGKWGGLADQLGKKGSPIAQEIPVTYIWVKDLFVTTEIKPLWFPLVGGGEIEIGSSVMNVDGGDSLKKLVVGGRIQAGGRIVVVSPYELEVAPALLLCPVYATLDQRVRTGAGDIGPIKHLLAQFGPEMIDRDKLGQPSSQQIAVLRAIAPAGSA